MTKLHETTTWSKIMDFYGFELLRYYKYTTHNICNKDLVVLCFISIILTQHSQHKQRKFKNGSVIEIMCPFTLMCIHLPMMHFEDRYPHNFPIYRVESCQQQKSLCQIMIIFQNRKLGSSRAKTFWLPICCVLHQQLASRETSELPLYCSPLCVCVQSFVPQSRKPQYENE